MDPNQYLALPKQTFNSRSYPAQLVDDTKQCMAFVVPSSAMQPFADSVMDLREDACHYAYLLQYFIAAMHTSEEYGEAYYAGCEASLKACRKEMHVRDKPKPNARIPAPPPNQRQLEADADMSDTRSNASNDVIMAEEETTQKRVPQHFRRMYCMDTSSDAIMQKTRIYVGPLLRDSTSDELATLFSPSNVLGILFVVNINDAQLDWDYLMQARFMHNVNYQHFCDRQIPGNKRRAGKGVIAWDEAQDPKNQLYLYLNDEQRMHMALNKYAGYEITPGHEPIDFLANNCPYQRKELFSISQVLQRCRQWNVCAEQCRMIETLDSTAAMMHRPSSTKLLWEHTMQQWSLVGMRNNALPWTLSPLFIMEQIIQNNTDLPLSALRGMNGMQLNYARMLPRTMKINKDECTSWMRMYRPYLQKFQQDMFSSNLSQEQKRSYQRLALELLQGCYARTYGLSTAEAAIYDAWQSTNRIPSNVDPKLQKMPQHHHSMFASAKADFLLKLDQLENVHYTHRYIAKCRRSCLSAQTGFWRCMKDNMITAGPGSSGKTWLVAIVLKHLLPDTYRCANNCSAVAMTNGSNFDSQSMVFDEPPSFFQTQLGSATQMSRNSNHNNESNQTNMFKSGIANGIVQRYKTEQVDRDNAKNVSQDKELITYMSCNWLINTNTEFDNSRNAISQRFQCHNLRVQTYKGDRLNPEREADSIALDVANWHKQQQELQILGGLTHALIGFTCLPEVNVDKAIGGPFFEIFNEHISRIGGNALSLKYNMRDKDRLKQWAIQETVENALLERFYAENSREQTLKDITWHDLVQLGAMHCNDEIAVYVLSEMLIDLIDQNNLQILHEMHAHCQAENFNGCAMLPTNTVDALANLMSNNGMVSSVAFAKEKIACLRARKFTMQDGRVLGWIHEIDSGNGQRSFQIPLELLQYQLKDGVAQCKRACNAEMPMITNFVDTRHTPDQYLIVT